ncbi:palmitoyltransferase DHHC11, putative [Plasmodium vinckei lentum]|uniref:Palmitoyltransferase n=1 Tax=Plasmodium vinckei lentum TaxID=138297 RepID=A0A6V7RWC4_PLAVN|nr:palmitoyltransferase DHHC11, putative [Plasmodium vinckei lentum]
MINKIKDIFRVLYNSAIILLVYGLAIQATYLCFKCALTFSTKIKIPCLISFGFTTCMTLWCHIKCLLKNPGYLNKSDFPGENINIYDHNISYCKKCDLPKIKRAHHCSACNKCVKKMDHHCTWINNCVGLYNQKFFILLNIYNLLMCCNCAFIIFYKLIMCIKRRPYFKDESCNLLKIDIFLIIVVSISSLIFGIFSFVMLVDQYWGIKTNTSGIEFLKNIKGEEQSFSKSFIEIFGEASHAWLIPVDAKIKDNLVDDFNENKKKIK